MDALPVKPFLDYSALVEKIASRKMLVEDPQRAARKIEQIGYYHLSGYWHLARSYDFDGDGKKIIHESFREGTSFNKVVDLYLLDKNLRVEFFNAIERIEIHLRTVIAHEMGRLDPLCYKEKKYFDKKYLPSLTSGGAGTPMYTEWISKLHSKTAQSKEASIKDHLAKNKPIPIWVLVEIWDFGMLSKFYSMLKTRHQNKICERFDSIPADVLENWLLNLNTVRNRCAHHSRLFNNTNARALKIPQRGYFNSFNISEHAKYKIYGIIIVVNYFLTKLSNSSDWVTRIASIIDNSPIIPGFSLGSMGFESGTLGFPIEKFQTTVTAQVTSSEPSVKDVIADLLKAVKTAASTDVGRSAQHIEDILTLAGEIEAFNVTGPERSADKKVK